jgi:hypothetical protein
LVLLQIGEAERGAGTCGEVTGAAQSQTVELQATTQTHELTHLPAAAAVIAAAVIPAAAEAQPAATAAVVAVTS